MYLCLSSGARPQYRHDVIRALALPRGVRLQFRYDLQWLAPAVKDRIATFADDPQRALIAYIDQADPTRVPTLVPCRYARIVEAVTHGTTVSLQLELEDFAYGQDIPAVNAELRNLAHGLPAPTAEGKIRGFYWTTLTAPPTTVTRADNLATWERIVCQLADHADFNAELLFYTVTKIAKVSDGSELTANNGRFRFRGRTEYELQLYHYHPKETPVGTSLDLQSASNYFRATTNTLVSIESRYDFKRFRFRFEPSVRTEPVVISLHRAIAGTPGTTVEFDVLGDVSGRLAQMFVYGVGLGLLLASPSVISALNSPTLQNRRAVMVWSVLIGVVTGIYAVFGLRKSV